MAVTNTTRWRWGTGIKWGTGYQWGGTTSEPGSPVRCGKPGTDGRYGIESDSTPSFSSEVDSLPKFYQEQSSLLFVDEGQLLDVIQSDSPLVEYFIIADPAGNCYELAVTAQTGLWTLTPGSSLPAAPLVVFDPQQIPWTVSVTLGGLLTWTNGTEIFVYEVCS